MARYMTHIHIGAGHAPGSHPHDWTTITIERAVDAPDRGTAYRAAEDYARSLSPEISAMIDHEDTRVVIDTALIG